MDLAPADDVSPHAQLGRRRPVLSVHGTFDLRDIGRDDLVAEARGWRVPARTAESVVDDVRNRLREWRTALGDAHPASGPALAGVRSRLASRW